MKKFLSIVFILLILGIALEFFLKSNRLSEEEIPAPIQVQVTETVPEIVIAKNINLRQGEVVKVLVNKSIATTSLVATFQNKKYYPIILQDEIFFVLPADLKAVTGTSTVIISDANGKVMDEVTVVIVDREKIEAPLGIPEKLGGNTPQGEQTVVSNLATENALINNVISDTSKQFFDDRFVYPLSSIIITDDYGYTRLTGSSKIAHKGTDFRAAIGTEVFAMNAGTVRFVRNLTVYGNSVIVDHGRGIQTLYMHLSEVEVKEGQTVVRGELIGKSGMTGYAESPHLHISLKMAGISIDPMQFFKLLDTD